MPALLPPPSSHHLTAQPRTNAYLRLFSATGYASPRAAALAHLLIKLLDDALCEVAYLAEVAGLHYGIW